MMTWRFSLLLSFHTLLLTAFINSVSLDIHCATYSISFFDQVPSFAIIANCRSFKTHSKYYTHDESWWLLLVSAVGYQEEEINYTYRYFAHLPTCSINQLTVDYLLLLLYLNAYTTYYKSVCLAWRCYLESIVKPVHSSSL